MGSRTGGSVESTSEDANGDVASVERVDGDLPDAVIVESGNVEL